MLISRGLRGRSGRENPLISGNFSSGARTKACREVRDGGTGADHRRAFGVRRAERAEASCSGAFAGGEPLLSARSPGGLCRCGCVGVAGAAGAANRQVRGSDPVNGVGGRDAAWECGFPGEFGAGASGGWGFRGCGIVLPEVAQTAAGICGGVVLSGRGGGRARTAGAGEAGLGKGRECEQQIGPGGKIARTSVMPARQF